MTSTTVTTQPKAPERVIAGSSSSSVGTRPIHAQPQSISAGHGGAFPTMVSSSWTRASILGSMRTDGLIGPQGVSASSLSGRDNVPSRLTEFDAGNLTESEPFLRNQRRSAGPAPAPAAPY
ncbi:hypothetical protein SeMB42_g07040, partial [Synchytrium endobioticum]